MNKNVCILFLICLNCLSAQQFNTNIFKDDFISVATDARAAGQGDIGVATSPDLFSQNWNPSKYIFSAKKFEVGCTRISASEENFGEINQANLNFYKKSKEERSAIGLSFKGYSYRTNNRFGIPIDAQEVAFDGSYTLRLSKQLSMSITGRSTWLEGKNRQENNNDFLFSVDVSAFYYGEEIGYENFNGRWRAGFNFSNLRGQSSFEEKAAESYAPSNLRVGTGFDFIFNYDKILGITTEYKTLLDSYSEDENGEDLTNSPRGSIIALGLEYMIKKKLIFRSGYSYGINRITDTFISLGAGFKSKYIDFDVAYIFASDVEVVARNKLRTSLILNLEKIIFDLN